MAKIDSFILDDFTWSFSRIETYDRCPLCFYLQYIKCHKGIEGVYGQYGSLIHDCLEKYLKGELEIYELSTYYKNNFSKNITCHFPENKYVDLEEKYYKQGLDYFNSFEGFGDREILSVESDYLFKVGDYNFTGKIDLECKGEIIDHKTKSKQHLKRLTKKHNKEDYVTMLDGRYIHLDNFKQLYLYAIPYKNKYGEYPKKLSLNMVRINDWYSVEFNIEHFEKIKEWAISKINSIYQTNSFIKGEDTSEYWCNNTCSQRLNCKYSDKYLDT